MSEIELKKIRLEEILLKWIADINEKDFEVEKRGERYLTPLLPGPNWLKVKGPRQENKSFLHKQEGQIEILQW